jgi:hypothetical protein
VHRVMEMKLAFRRTTQRRDVENLIRYLDKDEYCGGSGYAKEQAWHRLKAVELNGSQRRRLQEIALRYLHKRMNREFWYMCRFICGIADDAFRTRVAGLAESNDELLRKRASLLNAYLQDRQAGELAHQEFSYKCRRTGRYAWRPMSWYMSPE